MKKNLLQIIKDTANDFDQEWQAGAAFIEVESGCQGFDETNGKIVIQFEPAWFRKQAPYSPSGAWSLNKVERQKAEWLAFNNAFSLDKEAAMKSTSIGLGQIMGFHYKRLGYKSVGEMWDDAKRNESRQVWQIFKFIATDIKLQSALKAKDWDGVASIYNGSGYKALAAKYGREPYDVSMKNAYLKYRRL